MTTTSSSIMENKCANCSASLELEPDENSENEQNELILKRYYSLNVKSRFKSGGSKPPLGSHSQTPSRAKSSSAVEEISIRRALSLIFDLEIESPSDPTDPSSLPLPALPICFVCHLILNDLYRAYIEFSELRQNNSYLGRELLKHKKHLNCGRPERDRDHHHENVRLKSGTKRPRISSGSVSENSSFRERVDKEPIFQNSQPEENEASGLGIGIGIGISVGADVAEAADDPVRVKFEVFHDETETETEEAQNDSYEYENAESMDLGHTISSYKSEPDEEELQDRFSVEDETGAGGMPFVNIASSTSYSRPHHSRAQVDPGSSSSSYSMVSPYVEENDTDNFAGEDTGHDPLSLQTSSFASTRSRYFRGTDSINYEMILPNSGSGLGQNISQLTGSLISSPAAGRPRRRGPSQGQQHRDQGVPVQLNAVAGGSATRHVSEKKKIEFSIRKECTTKRIITDYQENPFSCDNCASRFRSNDRLVTHKYRWSDEAPPADSDVTTNVKKTKPSDVPDDAPPIGEKMVYTVSRRGQPMAAWQGHTFYFDRQSSDPNPRKIWRCSKQTKKLKCFKRIHTRGEHVVKELYEHNHSASEEEIHRRDFISDFKKSAATMLNEPASAIVAEKLSNISESFKSALPTVRAMKRTVSYMRSREKVNLPTSTWTGHPTVLPEKETVSTSSTLSITNVCTVTSVGANNSELSD